MKHVRKTLALTVMLAPLVAGTVFAHGGSGSGGSMMGNDSMMGGDSTMGPGMMGEYSEEQWNRFDRSFRDMERLMERIHQADDPDEHYRLMHEHMHQLQDGMMMMGEGWRMGSPDGDRSSGDLEDRMRNLERQLFMMQNMLNQLIEREAAEFDEAAE